MDINNGYDRHLDPPDDDIEQEYCEYCNEPMELTNRGFIGWKCANYFCPSEFHNTTHTQQVIDMAEHLAEVEQELRETKTKLKYSVRREEYAKLLLNRHQLVEVDYETQERRLFDELTQSQSNVVVRDTEYQITRMEDSLECLKECSDWDNFYEEFALVEKEWMEVRKILENR